MQIASPPFFVSILEILMNNMQYSFFYRRAMIYVAFVLPCTYLLTGCANCDTTCTTQGMTPLIMQPAIRNHMARYISHWKWTFAETDSGTEQQVFSQRAQQYFSSFCTCGYCDCIQNNLRTLRLHSRSSAPRFTTRVWTERFLGGIFR
jgi:hypothetical protein